MKKKAGAVFSSVSMKVIVIIIILVLPLNIIALSEASASINTTLEQVRMTEQNLADIYMADMNMRMKMQPHFSIILFRRIPTVSG